MTKLMASEHNKIKISELIKATANDRKLNEQPEEGMVFIFYFCEHNVV
jgi:hypothetical protein